MKCEKKKKFTFASRMKIGNLIKHKYYVNKYNISLSNAPLHVNIQNSTILHRSQQEVLGTQLTQLQHVFLSYELGTFTSVNSKCYSCDVFGRPK
jgi:hypothetical protein